MDKYSYVSNAEISYVDEMYQSYRNDPSSVDETWQKFFEGYNFSLQKYGEKGATNGGSTAAPSGNGVAATAASPATTVSEKEVRVHYLIHAYRSRGHLRSKTNPVRERKDRKPLLELSDFGLTDADLDTVFEAGNEIGIGAASLRKIVETLKFIYEGAIGFDTYEYLSMILTVN